MTQPIYKTEKRKAEVGERILITDKHKNEARYKNGDVFKVTQRNRGYVLSEKAVNILDYEYEVIVGEHSPVSNLDEMDCDELIALSEAVMKALRTRSYKNGYDQGRFDAEIEAAHGTYEKSDQQKRDDVVAKAKQDAEDLVRRHFVSKADFIVNAAKRTVVALGKSWIDGRILRRGIAKCAPTDCFNAHIGKAIALRRALGLEVPVDYLNVPQPTAVRVGDVVRGIYTGGNETYEETVGEIEGGKYKYIGGDFDYIEETDLVIIDDSRAGVSE